MTLVATPSPPPPRAGDDHAYPTLTPEQLAEHIAHKLADLPQRMVRRNPSLGCDVGKQPTLIHKYAPHASLRRFATKKLNHDAIAMARFFSGLLEQIPVT